MAKRRKSDPPDWHSGLHPSIWGQTDDRGLVITGLAFIEAHLETLLRRTLVDLPGDLDALLNNMPLAAKTRLALLVGAIPTAIAEDLHSLRAIRNDVAHSYEPFSLDAHTSTLRALRVLQAPELADSLAHVSVGHCLRAAYYVIARYLDNQAAASLRIPPKHPFRYTPP